MLQASGLRATCLTDPTQALEFLQRERPAGLILDCHMPLLNGLDLLRIIRAHPELGALPVLMISADPNPALVKEAQRLGASDFLDKFESLRGLIAWSRQVLRPKLDGGE